MNPIVLVAAMAWAVPAVVSAPAPGKLSLRWVSGQSIHLANNAGAVNRSHTATVTVILTIDHTVRVDDAGRRSENNLFKTYAVQDVTVWTNRWTGTWAADGDGMRLDLRLDDRACQRTRSDRAPGPACPQVTPRTRWTCASASVPVLGGSWARAGSDAPASEPVWRCEPVGRPSLGDTPGTWVFGKRACLGYTAGGGYRRCEG